MSVRYDIVGPLLGYPGGASGDPGATLAFHALTPDETTYEMLGVKTGTGDLTTTHTADLYAPDHEGVYQKFPANAPVWSGGRCVLSGGAGSDVTAVYADDGTGTPLAEVPYLQYYPAAENVLTYSNDQASWLKDGNTFATKDQVGLTGEPNTACDVYSNTATSATADIYLSLGAGTLDDVLTFVFYIKKAVSPVSAEVGLIGRASTIAICDFDAYTGTLTPAVQYDATEVIDIGGWWKVLLEVTTTSSGTRYAMILPTRTANTENHTTFGNVECHENKTIAQVRGLGPIFTTTAAVATDAVVASVDDANHDDTEGGYYFEFTPTFATSEVSGDQELLSLNAGADLLYYDAANSQAESSDGTNTSVKSLTLADDTEYQIGLAYGSSAMKINVDGVWGSEQTYDGAYPAGSALAILRNLSASGKIRNLRRYGGSYTDCQTAIEALMP